MVRRRRNKKQRLAATPFGITEMSANNIHEVPELETKRSGGREFRTVEKNALMEEKGVEVEASEWRGELEGTGVENGNAKYELP